MAFITTPVSLSTRTSFLPCTTRVHHNTHVLPQQSRVQTPIRMTATKLTQFDSLRAITTIVEDTGEIETIREHQPYAATTNPSLVAAAATLPEYEHLLKEAVNYGQKSGAATKEARLDITRNKLFTLFGAEILKYIPGDVSTEVDARLSFDVDKQVAVGEQLIRMYEEVGVERERVLIKLATTWEGVQACRQLEARGIRTNMTLLFNKTQAMAAAEAGAFLISPFVGRILDWYKKEDGVDGYPAEEDPGVKSVKEIFEYYKCMGHKTIVMGASFRNKGEILALAGCDRLTIAPKYIKDMKETEEDVDRKLLIPKPEECKFEERIKLDEKTFRWMMNEDPMATEKLAEGIRKFAKDLVKLDKQLEGMVSAL